MKFANREAVQIENQRIRVTVLREGGHIAEIMHKDSGVNPLWLPPWPSIEPSLYDTSRNPIYGSNSESKLLAGIMGHNLCLDVFGPPSSEEAAAGLTVHGESSVVSYQIDVGEAALRYHADLPLSGLRIARRIALAPDGETVHITEEVENRKATDRPIAWTQHVTLGPPFLRHGATQFHLEADRSRTFETDFGPFSLPEARDFDWPLVPSPNGDVDLSVFTNEPRSSKFTTHLMAAASPEAFFTAFDPASQIEFGYRWQRADFPWLGIWEENKAREATPWSSRTVACGFEFGVSPFPEPRRQMIDRGRLFDTPTYRWIPAHGKLSVRYSASIRKRFAKQ